MTLLYSVTDCDVMMITVLLVILCKAVDSEEHGHSPYMQHFITITSISNVDSDQFVMDMLTGEDCQAYQWRNCKYHNYINAVLLPDTFSCFHLKFNFI